MKITIIGAGAMGGAMAEGLLQSEKFTPSDITVSDHTTTRTVQILFQLIFSAFTPLVPRHESARSKSENSLV